MLSLERKLSNHEVLLKHWVPSVSLEYQGIIYPELLDSAFQRLCERNPILLSKIVWRDSRFNFCVSSSNGLKLKVLDFKDTKIEDLANTPPDCESGVAALYLLPDENKGNIVFSANHAIVDGRHMFALVNELLGIYTHLANGKPLLPVKQVMSLPGDPEESRKELISDKAPNTSKLQLSPDKISSMGGDIYVQKQHTRLDTATTHSIISMSRCNEVSVHGLVTGAVLSALRSCKSMGNPRVIQYSSPVDFRKRTQHEIAPNSVTNLAFVHGMTIDVDASDSPIELGKIVNADLKSALKEKNLFRSTRFDSKSGPAYDRRITVSNLGVIPCLECPDGVAVSRIEGHMPQRMKTPSPPSENLIFTVWTYQDQLQIDCFSFTPSVPPSKDEKKLDSLGDSVRRALLELAEN